jgi:hypothetical protein
MNTAQTQPQLTREEFHQQSIALANEFLAVFRGRPVSTGLVMQAAMEVHRSAAMQLSPQVQRDVSMAMASYAGELLQGLSLPNSPQSIH